MLECLRIQNLALMEAVEVSFGHGLNIVTGETGAGKSNLLEAIGLLLGSRGRVEVIRKGADHAVVEGMFDLSTAPWVRTRLEEQGFVEEGAHTSMVIRRVLHGNGKHRIYVNGQLCTLQQLNHLTDGLIDFCSQHEHQTLMRPTAQQDVVDAFGGLENDREEVARLTREWKDARQAIEAADRGAAERTRQIEFLRFQIDEIQRASLQPGEEEAWIEERRTLSQVGVRKQALAEAAACLGGDGPHERGDAAFQAPAESLRICEQRLTALEPELAAQVQKLRIELESVQDLVLQKLESCALSPERREWLEERLYLIQNLKRKYGPDVPSILETFAQLQAQLAKLEVLEQPRAVLVERESLALERLRTAFDHLHQQRLRHAEKLSHAIARELRDLCIDKAAFRICVTPREDFKTETEFLIRTNAGEDLQPLTRVASGGELSRVMLAIRRVCVQGGKVGVYLFDEIDAGLGGTIAYHVGKKLKQVAKSHQILCVTHLPQVAAFADTHLHVAKSRQGERTVSHVQVLQGELRVGELARMMSGKKPTPVSLANAQEMLAGITS